LLIKNKKKNNNNNNNLPPECGQPIDGGGQPIDGGENTKTVKYTKTLTKI
jgi:hypothetical protein